MTTLTETKHPGEFIASEANDTISRDTVTLVSGQNCVAGTVLGKITTGGKYTILAPGASDGSQAAAAVLFDNVDATAGDTLAVVIARTAELNAGEVTWPAGITGPQKLTATGQLAALGVTLR